LSAVLGLAAVLLLSVVLFLSAVLRLLLLRLLSVRVPVLLLRGRRGLARLCRPPFLLPALTLTLTLS
jgi:hypothetical protein